MNRRQRSRLIIVFVSVMKYFVFHGVTCRFEIVGAEKEKQWNEKSIRLISRERKLQ